MSSVLRSVRKRKKGHTVGAVDVIDREEYAELEVDAKVELIRSLVPLGLMHIEELLDEEVTALAISEFPKWRKYLISLSFRGQSSVRPVQVGGFNVNIVIHRFDCSPRTRRSSST